MDLKPFLLLLLLDFLLLEGRAELNRVAHFAISAPTLGSNILQTAGAARQCNVFCPQSLLQGPNASWNIATTRPSLVGSHSSIGNPTSKNYGMAWSLTVQVWMARVKVYFWWCTWNLEQIQLDILVPWHPTMLSNFVQFGQCCGAREKRNPPKNFSHLLLRVVTIEVHRGWWGCAWREGGGGRCGRAKHCPALGRSPLPLATKVEGGFDLFQPSFYFKRCRTVWWQPWPGSPFLLLTFFCLLPRSSILSPPWGWTWRETAMLYRMWTQLRWEDFYISAASTSQIDPLGRLWVVDSGQTAPFSRPHRKCPPKIFVFDLSKGQWLICSHTNKSWPFQGTNWWQATFLRTIGTHCSSRSLSTCLTVRVTHSPTSPTLQVAECSPSGGDSWSIILILRRLK